MKRNNIFGMLLIAIIMASTALADEYATGGRGSSGGYGGGGVITAESLSNIVKAETYDKNLIANTPVTYTFKAPEHGIYEIIVTGKENENDIAIRVEALKATSKLAAVSPPGIVYKNVNVWAGTKRIKEILIRFRVENTWLDSNSVQKEDLKLLRWSDNDWKSLDTTVLTKDDTYTYFEAQSAGLSSFAVSVMKEGQVPVETTLPSTTVTTPAINASTPGKKPTPGFGMLVTVLVVSAIYLLRRRDG